MTYNTEVIVQNGVLYMKSKPELCLIDISTMQQLISCYIVPCYNGSKLCNTIEALKYGFQEYSHYLHTWVILKNEAHCSDNLSLIIQMEN